MQAENFQEAVAFDASRYQEAIFRFQEEDTRDAFVNAKAGSGKTTTLVQCALRLPAAKREHAIFVAFNKHIADELAQRLPEGLVARTIHSLGREAIKNYVNPNDDWKVERYKYKHLARLYSVSIGLNPYSPAGKALASTIEQMMGFVMVTLTDPNDKEGLNAIATHYDIIVEDWNTIYDAVPKLLTWGFIGTETPDGDGRYYSIEECVSFDEMLYLPTYLDLPITQYDMIYCDEAQDLSAAQREIVLKMRSPGGRIFFVGDPNQAIYGFAGADSRSVKAILDRTQAVELPLSICYRCPKSHIRLAQAIVPEIQAHSAAAEGSVEEIHVSHLANTVRVGDLILCRTTSPLISTALHLIEADISAKVRGRDIGNSLINLVDSVEKMAEFTFSRFSECLGLFQDRMIEQYRRKDFSDLEIEAINDRVDSLLAIFRRKSELGKLRTVAGLRASIENIFSDEREAVTLCTVHRAKGLEAERVFLLEEDMMPHPKATEPHEIEQEWNLRYVALTRAQKALYFVRNQVLPEQEIPDFARDAPEPTHPVSTTHLQMNYLTCEQAQDHYLKGCICLKKELFGLAVLHFRKLLNSPLYNLKKIHEAEKIAEQTGLNFADLVQHDRICLRENLVKKLTRAELDLWSIEKKEIKEFIRRLAQHAYMQDYQAKKAKWLETETGIRATKFEQAFSRFWYSLNYPEIKMRAQSMRHGEVYSYECNRDCPILLGFFERNGQTYATIKLTEMERKQYWFLHLLRFLVDGRLVIVVEEEVGMERQFEFKVNGQIVI